MGQGQTVNVHHGTPDVLQLRIHLSPAALRALQLAVRLPDGLGVFPDLPLDRGDRRLQKGNLLNVSKADHSPAVSRLGLFLKLVQRCAGRFQLLFKAVFLDFQAPE